MMKSLVNKTYKIYIITFIGSLLLAFLLVNMYKFLQASYSIEQMLVLIHSFPRAYLINTVTLTALIYFICTTIIMLIQVRRTTKDWTVSLSVYMLLILVSLAVSILFFMVQNTMDAHKALLWMKQYPNHVMMTAILITSIMLFIFALFGSYYLGAIVAMAGLCLLALTNYLKLKILGQPLYPTDFGQLKQVRDLIPMIIQKVSILSLVALVLGLVTLVILKTKLPKYKPHWLHRILVAGTSGFIIWSYANYEGSIMSAIFKVTKIELIKWDPVLNYDLNGAVLGFVLSINQNVFEKPKDYSKENVLQVAQAVAHDLQEQIVLTETAAAVKPNIIYLMNEAFWDPTRLPNVQFEKDPIPYIREVMQQNPSGYTLSPMFGGGTANVEFEALTGFSLSFLEQGSVPYMQVFDKKKSVPNIASILRQRGYDAVAFHSFEKYFFKRDVVYPKLGFQSFTSMKEMKHKEMAAEHVSNMSVSKELIDMLKSHTNPVFIHTVTMQNHFPYLPGRFKTTEINVEGLDEKSNQVLETYTEGVRQSNEAFQYLMEQLDTLDEPTIVVFWGDHLPTFGENNNAIYNSGFIKTGGTSEESRRMHETPFFITANFPIPPVNLGTTSPIYFGPILFQILQEPLPPYYQFLMSLYERYHGIIRELKVNPENGIITTLTKADQKLLDEYRLLQYDLLIGEQYSRPVLFPGENSNS
ncbi:sulfatase-like hydrolase/transferase [Ectobacillus funiculus]|uniref:LTA synthase family protein n=1 Tax=Ectobacillus funiculus TaxID=137993 RepID=UPI003979B73C